MAGSPLPAGASGGVPVLGFLACAAVVRREAFLAAGGFDERLGVGGEGALLAIDMATRGWDLVHPPDVVAHHHPPVRAERSGRRRVQARTALWCAWLAEAVRKGAWVARSRRAVATGLEARLRLLERPPRSGVAPRGGATSSV